MSADIRDLVAGPGTDTRAWCSYATVDAGTEDAPSVRYRDQNGHVIAPLVSCTLQPSGVSVVARVGAGVAGITEGEWTPIMDGDELLVLVPEGDERAGPVIVARLNNEIDEFPQTVAGLDATKNNFAFRRRRTSYVEEVDGGYLVRSSKTGAQFGFDQKGQLIVNDGAGNRIFMGADGLGIGTPEDGAAVQAFGEKKQVLIVADTASFLFDGAETTFITKGTLNIATSGVAATGHAITLEQVVSILANMIVTMNSVGAFNPIFSGTFAGGFPGTLLSILGAAVTGAALPVPITPATPGGNLTPLTGLQQLISTGLFTQGADPQSLASGVPIFQPGIGRPGFLI